MRHITREELVHDYADAYVISGRNPDCENIQKLIDMGFRTDHIFARHMEWCKQYFDQEFLVPGRKEVFVDGGSFNLKNSFDFMEWCHGNFEKIYAFEPDSNSFSVCREILNCQPQTTKDKIHLIQAATWSREEKLYFSDDGTGSSKVLDSGNCISADSIDHVLQGGKATYIKLDVEGAELEALKGARETIYRFHPRLAICVYHREEDILNLAEYILSIRMDYRFYIRHYSTCFAETVLYCV